MAPSQSYEREDKWLHYPLHNKQALPRQRLVRWGSCGWRYFSPDLQPLSGQEVLFQGVGQEQQGLRSLQLHRIFRHSSRKRFRCSDLPQQPWWQTHATKVRLWATDLTLHWLSGFLKFSLFQACLFNIFLVVGVVGHYHIVEFWSQKAWVFSSKSLSFLRSLIIFCFTSNIIAK